MTTSTKTAKLHHGKKIKVHAVSVAGTTKLNSNLFGAIYLILSFITKTRLFILQLTSQSKGVCDANREWQDS